MTKLKNNDGSRLHPWVPELADMARRRRIGRRDFLRTTALLGVSVASAKAFLATTLGQGLLGPRPAMAQAPVQGGTLRMAMQTQEITDPALYNWIEASNITRNVIEYLTHVDADNVVHPYLAESWLPSDDLRTWTFKLRQNVKWSNGDDFTAEDVAHNFARWLDPGSKSVNRTQFAGVRVEVVGPHELKLHLERPKLSVPEELYAYTCSIVHRRFDEQGANFQENPIGTGPYNLADFQIGRIARVTRRDGYWGKPPYLDEIQYIDLGTDIAAHLAALAAGQVDILYRITTAEVGLAKRLPNVQIIANPSAATFCLRMQIDKPPFDDIRVRKAIVLAADNQQMLDLASQGQGLIGENHHVAPVHPEYFKLPPITRDVAQAKQLLADAGHSGGLQLAIDVGNTQGRVEQDTAQVLAQNLAEIGVNLRLNVLPNAQYWPIWNKTPFGLTFWAHRPLAVMTLDLAYRSGGTWNETHYADAAFDTALNEAMAVVNPEERSRMMEAPQRMLQDAAIMVQPFFQNTLTAASTRVQNFKLNPARYYRMDEVYLA